MLNKVLLFSLSASSVLANHVIDVDHDNFDEVIAANPYLLLSMTSPDCGHC